MSFPSSWQSRDDDELRQLWGSGASSNEIGRRMRRTKNSIIGRARRLGLDARPSPIAAPIDPAVLAKVKAMLQSGQSPRHVASVTDVKHDTVATIRRRMDLPKLAPQRTMARIVPRKPLVVRKPTTTPEDEARIRDLGAQGLSYRKIALRTGFTDDIVRRVLRVRPDLPPVSSVIRLQAPSRPVITAPAPRPAQAAIPHSGSCQWPMWGDRERPRFRADGGPDVCGAARCRGSYCGVHGRVAYTRREDAA